MAIQAWNSSMLPILKEFTQTARLRNVGHFVEVCNPSFSNNLPWLILEHAYITSFVASTLENYHYSLE